MLIMHQAGNFLSYSQGQVKEVINTGLMFRVWAWENSSGCKKAFKRITRKRINSANQPKYLFDPGKDIQAKLFTQTPLMKTDLTCWSVMMLTQREVSLTGGLSLFLMSCHIKTSEGQQHGWLVHSENWGRISWSPSSEEPLFFLTEIEIFLMFIFLSVWVLSSVFLKISIYLQITAIPRMRTLTWQ